MLFHDDSTATCLIGVLAALLLLSSVPGCANSVLLYPSTEPMSIPGVREQFVDFGKRRIEICVARSPGAAEGHAVQAYVLEFCGNAARAEQSAAADAMLWDSRPVEIWALNYPGYGKSDGPVSLHALAPAALAAYDSLARHAAGRPIFIAGVSLGSAVALDVAVHRPAAGLILQSPPPLQREIMERYGWWNLWLIAGPIALGVPQDLNSLSNGLKSHAPALFILTGSDNVVPLRFQRMVCDQYAGEKHIFIREGADHNDPLDPQDKSRLEAELDWLFAQKGVGTTPYPATRRN